MPSVETGYEDTNPFSIHKSVLWLIIRSRMLRHEYLPFHPFSKRLFTHNPAFPCHGNGLTISQRLQRDNIFLHFPLLELFFSYTTMEEQWQFNQQRNLPLLYSTKGKMNSRLEDVYTDSKKRQAFHVPYALRAKKQMN